MDLLKRGMLITILLALAIVVLIFIFYPKNCENLTCFNSALLDCKKAHFISTETDSVFEYRIIGKSGNTCRTDVTLLQLSSGEIEMKSLEGKSMSCFTSIGNTLKPNTNLDNCHGLLKEEMQNILIKRMHSYILSNLGEIGKELEEVV